MTTENGDNRLTDFGKRRVNQIARTRAERIDESTSTWRYHAAALLAFMQLGAGIGFTLGLAAIPVTVLLGEPVPWVRYLGQLVLMFVAAAALGYASNQVENDYSE